VSYAAEPYAQFVDDLLTTLTGGVVRERFSLVPEDAPYRLSPPGPIVKNTVHVFGIANGTFARFRSDLDYTLTDNTIDWNKQADGTPAAGAVWPDAGTPFFVNYDHTAPSGPAPLLNDRNPGSVTRLLAESFAREYAVLSRQLESVYRGGFLDTATGRDLEQLVVLLGLRRRDRTYATGTVVFARATPAAADIFIAAGARISTADSPVAVFESSEDRTLTRGSLSVEVPIRATISGSAGVVPPLRVTAIHRPILGIESISNPAGTQLVGTDETDEALRIRARRALEGAGKATTGAIVSALATLPAIREKDIFLSEDPLTRPGMITLSIATQLGADDVNRVIDVVERTRAAGVRVVTGFDSSTPGPIDPSPNPDDDTAVGAEAVAVKAQMFLPVSVYAVLVPSSSTLSAQDRQALKRKGEDVLRAVVADAGVGETLVYNRLVAALMALEGVQDVTLDSYTGPLPPSHRNLVPPPNLRPSIDPKFGGSLEVEIGGQLVALDLTIKITLKGAGALGNRTADLEDARVQAAGQLRLAVRSLTSLSAISLKAAVSSVNFTLDWVGFTWEYVQAGVRVNKTFVESDPAIAISPLQKLWIRTVRLDAGSS
jgi:phage-related baseplate assembly protein